MVKVYFTIRNFKKGLKHTSLLNMSKRDFTIRKFKKGLKRLSSNKKELLSFNPEKPFRKDDCIDCIASALNHNEVIAPPKESQTLITKERTQKKTIQWRI